MIDRSRRPNPLFRLVSLLPACALIAGGCAARRPPDPQVPVVPVTPVTAAPASAPLPAPPPAGEEVPIEAAPALEAPASTPAEAPPPERPRLRELCRQAAAGEEPLVDDMRRYLSETFCGAQLWFDGLFGGQPDVASARQVSGRVELSTVYTEYDGFDTKARLRLNYDLPNLERRVNIFLGRDDRDEFIEDRQEGVAIRSSVLGLEQQDRWLAGLGYSPPGRWGSRVDFRVGARLKSAPEVFAQGRYRRNVFMGDDSVWRFRETVFWENREGYGFTSSIDFDHVLRRDLLMRLGAVSTVSESTEGMAWRLTSILYRNLRKNRAVAGELFARGSTAADVELREYGTRAVYRQSLGRPYLFGDVILGYTWPRKELTERREGSAMLGFGIELLFGRDPW